MSLLMEGSSFPEREPSCPLTCRHQAARQAHKAFPHANILDSEAPDSYPYTFYCRIHKADFTLWIQRINPREL